ncbi:MAG TPA: hypothetical protein VGF26_21185 [Ramlibacter sp.]
MTWQNPELSTAARTWRTAQSAVLQAQRKIRVLDEECSDPRPARPVAGDVTLLEAQAKHALSECLRIARQADRLPTR